MSDDTPKSALELAMERLQKKDADAGIETRPLTDAQKAQIADIRQIATAKIAELNPQRFGIPDGSTAARLSLLSVAVWWVLFSIPLFRQVPEPARRLEASETGGESAIRIAARRLALERGFIVGHCDFDRLLVIESEPEPSLRQRLELATDADNGLDDSKLLLKRLAAEIGAGNAGGQP